MIGLHKNSRQTSNSFRVLNKGSCRSNNSTSGYFYLKETKISQKDIYTPMFIAALFTVAKIQKQPKCPSMEQIENLWYIHHRILSGHKKGIPAIYDNMNGSRGYYAKWNKLEKDKYHMISFICGLPRWFSGKESTCQCRRQRTPCFDPWVEKVPWRRNRLPTPIFLGFPSGSDSKESTCHEADPGFNLPPGRSLGGGHGNQYSRLENPVDRGAWWTTVHRVAKSPTQLSNWVCTRICGIKQTNKKPELTDAENRFDWWLPEMGVGVGWRCEMRGMDEGSQRHKL